MPLLTVLALGGYALLVSGLTLIFGQALPGDQPALHRPAGVHPGACAEPAPQPAAAFRG